MVITRPATRRTGVTHETRGAPSTSTVQHPHWPWGLQPSLGERTPRWSRRATSSDEPSSGTSTSVPSTTKATVARSGSGATGSDIGRRIGSRPDEPRTAAPPARPARLPPPRRRGRRDGRPGPRRALAPRRLRVERLARSSGDRLTLTTSLDGRQLVGLFNYTGGYVEAGTPQRLALAIASPEGPPEADGPATLTVQLSREGTPVGAPITIPRHADGVPIGYYPLVTTFDQAGTWTVSTELDGQTADQAFRVEAPGGSSIVQVGEAMIPVSTPTTADARGVTPICTRSPQCPFHGQTLTEALAGDAPVALMISTPQYCQTGVCGPVLDLVMEQAAATPGVQVVHAEVYVEPGGRRRPRGQRPHRRGERLRPVVRAQPVRGPGQRRDRGPARQHLRPRRAGPGLPAATA